MTLYLQISQSRAEELSVRSSRVRFMPMYLNRGPHLRYKGGLNSACRSSIGATVLATVAVLLVADRLLRFADEFSDSHQARSFLLSTGLSRAKSARLSRAIPPCFHSSTG